MPASAAPPAVAPGAAAASAASRGWASGDTSADVRAGIGGMQKGTSAAPAAGPPRAATRRAPTKPAWLSQPPRWSAITRSRQLSAPPKLNRHNTTQQTKQNTGYATPTWLSQPPRSIFITIVTRHSWEGPPPAQGFGSRTRWGKGGGATSPAQSGHAQPALKRCYASAPPHSSLITATQQRTGVARQQGRHCEARRLHACPHRRPPAAGEQQPDA